jgi:hypothetical protein
MQHKIDQHAMGSRLSAVCANLLDDSVPPPACLVPGGYDLIFSKLVFHHIGDCASMVGLGGAEGGACTHLSHMNKILYSQSTGLGTVSLRRSDSSPAGELSAA